MTLTYKVFDREGALIGTFRSKGLHGVKNRLWALNEAKVQSSDGQSWFWNGEKLLAEN